MCVAEDRGWTCHPAPGAHALGKEVKVSLSLSHTHTHTHMPIRLNNRETVWKIHVPGTGITEKERKSRMPPWRRER